ncbi:hypothetical protein XELAEV_18022105mg [Xenopus laevis]|uniref:Large ribosomal subunit protein P2 n=1 Tax=Xenopus laevis TaxID=8355 RepID=A0A974D4D1_XENLA|nr:hypothetical protein XELAEV_18022105mg [Xenopus laevis]
MRYVAAYLLAALGGTESPTIADLTKILNSVGIETDQHRAEKVVGELKGKSIDEIIAQGKQLSTSLCDSTFCFSLFWGFCIHHCYKVSFQVDVWGKHRHSLHCSQQRGKMTVIMQVLVHCN